MFLKIQNKMILKTPIVSWDIYYLPEVDTCTSDVDAISCDFAFLSQCDPKMHLPNKPLNGLFFIGIDFYFIIFFCCFLLIFCLWYKHLTILCCYKQNSHTVYISIFKKQCFAKHSHHSSLSP